MGFIGSHLCERLLAQGNDEICIDNFYTGMRDNIAHLQGEPHFELLGHDITLPLYVDRTSRSKLGWGPCADIDAGLRKVIDYSAQQQCVAGASS